MKYFMVERNIVGHRRFLIIRVLYYYESKYYYYWGLDVFIISMLAFK